MKLRDILVTMLLFVAYSQAAFSQEATELDISTAKSMHDDGVVFIDARRASSFKFDHIPGAINVPVLSDDFTEANLTSVVSKDQPVVFYCNCGPNCSYSPFAAKKALEMGFQNVQYLKAAIDGWNEAGFPIETPN
jgi:rhodanese-related sulfurtransferase